MFCSKCGKELEDGARFCPACGAQTGVDTQTQVPQVSQIQPAYSAAMPQADTKGRAASLACGILSLVFCWLPILGLILGIVAIVTGSKSNKAAKNGMSTAGFVLGVIGLVISVIIWIGTAVAAIAFYSYLH